MGVAGFGVENRRRPFFMGKHISVICTFIKYSDLRGSRYLSKRNGTEIIECSGDAGSGEKRC